MDPEAEDESIPISALQHMLYCPRQCALIHVERQWKDNFHTAEGRMLHRRVESGESESRRDLVVHRSVPLRSSKLGLFGYADVIEMLDGGRRPHPVEYKRGRPKSHRADEVQLCAQALCIEEMTGLQVPSGNLFYGRIRRRKEVVFDSGLRDLTGRTAEEARRMMASGETPPPEYEPKKCSACSLEPVCQPEAGTGTGGVLSYISAAVEDRPT